MKKYLRSFTVFMLVTMMLFFSTISAFAAGKENTLKTTPTLSQDFNEWVTYDDEANQFLITTGAKDILGQSDYELLNKCLAITNSKGGTWIPELVVSEILSTLGVVVALCPGRIAFDYNDIAAGIGKLVPKTSIFFSAVSNIRWQQ